MSEPAGEFTGERVIPGQVNVDLWNEHLSRYAFAARFARGRRVVDLGCGSGYGSAELARTAQIVLALDVSAEAVTHGRANYRLPNLNFLQASCTDVPIASKSAGLVVAYEVIEHLDDWPRLIAEAARLVDDAGVFIVSTPNRLYYADSRAAAGPNPFHQHEFDFDEFQTALAGTFPYTNVVLQNRAECLAFYPPRTFLPADALIESVSGSPAEAHFFIAICSRAPLQDLRSFAYVPRAANVLREREQHIAKLSGELHLNRSWLAEARAERDAVLRQLADTEKHLEEHNRWALELEQLWHKAQSRVVELQEQLAAEQQSALAKLEAYETKVRELDADILAKTQWALDTEQRLTAEVELERTRFADALDKLHASEATVEERTKWARSLEQRVGELESLLQQIRGSRWIDLGRRLGLGPRP